MANTAYNNYVNHTGMTVEQVKAIDLECRRYAQDAEKFWAQFFDTAKWERGHKTFQHRKHIRPEVTYSTATAMKLAEGYGAVKSNIKVVNWEETVDDYGTFIPYTAESIAYNIDDTLQLCKNQFSTLMVEVPEKCRANAICTSNFTMAPATVSDVVNYVATFDKAKVILDKKLSKTINGYYIAIITPEIEASLKAELRALGTSLDPVTKEDVTREGTVYKFDKFLIVVRADEAMYATVSNVNKQKIVFICKTRDNELPGSEITPEFDIFDNGLGSGLVEANTGSTDASPVYVADTNKREGSVAININHFGAGIQADLGHLVCVVDAATGYTPATQPSNDPINGVANTSTAPVLS